MSAIVATPDVNQVRCEISLSDSYTVLSLSYLTQRRSDRLLQLEKKKAMSASMSSSYLAVSVVVQICSAAILNIHISQRVNLYFLPQNLFKIIVFPAAPP